MKRRWASFFLAAALILAPVAANAASVDQLTQQAQNLDAKVQTLKNQADAKANQAASLSQQLSIMRGKAADLQSKISSLQDQINKINKSMAAKQAILDQAVKQQYVTGQTTPLEMLYSSENISQFLDSQQYLQASQQKVESLIADIEADKKLIEKQQTELGTQKKALAAQEKAIHTLLVKTRGEQARYETLMKQAAAEEDKIISSISAMIGTGSEKSYGFVFKGQVIGHEGSTGK